MIQSVGFLDLSNMTSTFVRNYREKLKDDLNYPGAKTLLLRGADAPAPILKEWKSATQVLRRLQQEAAPFLKGKPATLGKAMIVSLAPGAFVDWAISTDDYTLAHHRLHVCMIPSPGAFIYSGGGALNLPVGQVTYVAQTALHSEINVGPCARVHLVVDVRVPDDDQG